MDLIDDAVAHYENAEKLEALGAFEAARIAREWGDAAMTEALEPRAERWFQFVIAVAIPVVCLIILLWVAVT